ncbi:GNAT family N-acetyltransferase [Streptomyces bambusae]|uniref:GNAT family N-acetyltransferase n=1 Tax=Streptomyces bambusae TaxID=1550616 RepID=UPI001CFCE40F|nr:GNAT family N-acetyltransferase [Streptomyces bambusae]MCB5165753.1 GNAT family N-acetyltransferase [Streptomyces bambusae]
MERNEKFEITPASRDDMALLRAWADDEGWNPGDTDVTAFAVADPAGFLVGRLDGKPVACISAVRYGTGFGFIGFYIARPEVRGQGYGIRMWNAGMARLEGRLVGLDGVLDQQDNYRRSGFRSAWNNIRYEGRVPDTAPPLPDGVELADAGTLPFDRLAAYDRRFFPEPRDGFLSAWTGLPGRTALAAVRDGRIEGLGVIRPCSGASRIGPLYADDPETAAALLHALAARTPQRTVAVDVPDANPAATALATGLGLTPSFEAARMYTGDTPDLDLPGIYGVTSLELG